MDLLAAGSFMTRWAGQGQGARMLSREQFDHQQG